MRNASTRQILIQSYMNFLCVRVMTKFLYLGPYSSPKLTLRTCFQRCLYLWQVNSCLCLSKRYTLIFRGGSRGG